MCMYVGVCGCVGTCKSTYVRTSMKTERQKQDIQHTCTTHMHNTHTKHPCTTHNALSHTMHYHTQFLTHTQGPRSAMYQWGSLGKFIAFDIAKGLVYLHSHKPAPYVHCTSVLMLHVSAYATSMLHVFAYATSMLHVFVCATNTTHSSHYTPPPRPQPPPPPPHHHHHR